MRSHFGADWAFGIKGGIESVVREQFPHDLRNWPLLETFNYDAFSIGESHFVMVLRDKLSGIPAGPGDLQPFPFSDHPDLPPTASHADLWQTYLNTKFDLQPHDAAFILPIHDCGRNAARGDFDMFTPAEHDLWHVQLNSVISRQHALIQRPHPVQPIAPTIITYNVSGTNTRVNINSVDSSVNTVDTNTELFEQLREVAREKLAESDATETVIDAINAMESASGTKRFIGKYQDFMGIIADHIQVFSFAIPTRNRSREKNCSW